MSAHGLYIIKKNDLLSFSGNKYLAIDGLFIEELLLGLKSLEANVIAYNDVDYVKEIKKACDLNQYIEEGANYLEGAILVDYDKRVMAFYGHPLFGKLPHLKRAFLQFLQTVWADWKVYYCEKEMYDIANILAYKIIDHSIEDKETHLEGDTDEPVSIENLFLKLDFFTSLDFFNLSEKKTPLLKRLIPFSKKKEESLEESLTKAALEFNTALINSGSSHEFMKSIEKLDIHKDNKEYLINLYMNMQKCRT